MKKEVIAHNKERISVVILTYKNYIELERTLESVYLQDYPNIQLIIFDDCTPGITEKDIKKITEKFVSENITDLIIHRNDKNVGTVKNFNRALKQATGCYIFPISSSDMFANKGVISSVVQYFNLTKCLVCTTKRIIYNADKKKQIIKPTVQDICYLDRTPKNTFVYLSLNHFMGVGTYFSKDVFLKYGYFDENYRLIEDLPFYLHLLERGEKICFMDAVTMIYMPGGITSGKFQFESQLNQDRIKIFHNIILPRIEWFNFREKRKLMFSHTFECYRNNKVKLLIACVLYPENLVSKVFNRLKNI